ncbi:MAG: hypothetical protein R3B07_32125 [Polyangiaceae bacterium]
MGVSRHDPGSLEIHANHYTPDMRQRDQAARRKPKTAAPKPQKASKTMPKYRSEDTDIETRLTNLEKRMTALEKKLKGAAPEDEGDDSPDARAPRLTNRSGKLEQILKKQGRTLQARPPVEIKNGQLRFNAEGVHRMVRDRGARK